MSEPREIIPDAFRTTVHRLPSGSVVITQSGDGGDQVIIVPAAYIKAFCDGVYHASMPQIGSGGGSGVAGGLMAAVYVDPISDKT